MRKFNPKLRNRDAKTIATVVAVLVSLTVFYAVYFYAAEPDVRQVMIYFLVLAGLYFSLTWIHAGIVIGAAGILFLAFSGGNHWPVITGSIALMLAGTALVPYYYGRLLRYGRIEFRKGSSLLKQKASGLEDELVVAEKERKTLEDEIEKINQLYILGRDLVEKMELEDVLEHLQRILLNRPGVYNVGVFSWEKNNWKILSCSDQELREKLLIYIKSQINLRSEKEIRQLQAPEYMPGKTIVFWPIRLEKDLMSAVLIITDAEYAARCAGEGEVFIPQITLGLKRTRLFAEVRERSRADGLTGLYLRRYFLERMQIEIQRAKRYSGIFSVLMIDLDFFKKVNDTYGHITGDKVLCGVSRIFVDCLRPGDLVGRFGGEEFIVLIPMTPKEEILGIAKEINRMVSEKEFSAGNEKFGVKVSIGISHYPQDGTSVDDIISSADKALYWVKTNGRNSVKEYGQIRKTV